MYSPPEMIGSIILLDPHHSPLGLLPFIVSRLKASSASTTDGNISPPSSPHRNAAFSRLGPEVGRRLDLRKGDYRFVSTSFEWMSLTGGGLSLNFHPGGRHSALKSLTRKTS